MSNINLSENIANKIKHNIIIGEYGLGTQLPNEQELCAFLNVSRTTVREAIKLLVSKNILEIERGVGTFVAAVPGLSEDPFGLEFVSDDVLKVDLRNFRIIVEPKVCCMAAKNATDEQLKVMSQQIAMMEDIVRRANSQDMEEWIDEFIDKEISFHVLLYKMSGNVLFERMGDLVTRSVIVNSTALKYRQTFDFAKNFESHASLYKAIAEKDSDAAEKLGYEHCQNYSFFE